MKKALFLSLAFACTGSIFSSEIEAPNTLILDFKVTSTQINETWSNIAEAIKNLADNPDEITKESSIELVKKVCIVAKNSEKNDTKSTESIDINMFATADSAEINSSIQEEHSGIIRFALSKTDDCSDELWTAVIEKAQQFFASDEAEELINNQVTLADFATSKLNEFNEVINESNGQLTGSVFISLVE